MKRTLAIALVALSMFTAAACASSHPRVKRIQYPPTMMPESPTFTAGDNVLTNDQQLTDAR